MLNYVVFLIIAAVVPNIFIPPYAYSADIIYKLCDIGTVSASWKLSCLKFETSFQFNYRIQIKPTKIKTDNMPREVLFKVWLPCIRRPAGVVNRSNSRKRFIIADFILSIKYWYSRWLSKRNWCCFKWSMIFWLAGIVRK